MKTIKRIGALSFIFLLGVVLIYPLGNTDAETPKSFTIKFNSNDGGGVVIKKKKLYNVSIAIPEFKITHEGFGFMGWTTDKHSQKPEYRYGDSISENKNMTLYAIWHKTDDNSEDYVMPKRVIKAKNQSFKKGSVFKIKSKITEPGKIEYKSHNKSIVKFTSSGKGKAVSRGKTKVDIIAVGDGLYREAKKTITVKVK